MATFVELAQELRRICGIQGTGPTDVTTATGIELRLVNYIKNAWIDIQAHPKLWRWMLLPYYQSTGPDTPLQTIASTASYLLPTTVTTVDKIAIRTCKSYLTATGTSDRQRMRWMPWRSFEQKYGVVTANDGRPIVITREPNGRIQLYPPPDGVYSIEFEHFKAIQVLAANTDVPDLPAEFHQLIVYEACKRFGKAEDAPEIIRLGEDAGGSEGSEGRPVSGLWRALIWSQEVKEEIESMEETQMTITTRNAYEDY